MNLFAVAGLLREDCATLRDSVAPATSDDAFRPAGHRKIIRRLQAEELLAHTANTLTGRALAARAWAFATAICLVAILSSDVQSAGAIQKSLGLLRAGDPVVLTPSIRDGASIIEAPHDDNSKLQRAVGL